MNVGKIYNRLIDAEHPDALTDDYIAFLWGRAEQIAAQQKMHLTAFGVGMLAFLAGFGICWLVFVR